MTEKTLPRAWEKEKSRREALNLGQASYGMLDEACRKLAHCSQETMDTCAKNGNMQCPLAVVRQLRELG